MRDLIKASDMINGVDESQVGLFPLTIDNDTAKDANTAYYKFLAHYIKHSTGKDSSNMSPAQMDREYGAQIKKEFGLKGTKYRDLTHQLYKKGHIVIEGKVNPRQVSAKVYWSTDDRENFEYMDGMMKIADGKNFEKIAKSIMKDLHGEGFEREDVMEFFIYKLMEIDY